MADCKRIMAALALSPHSESIFGYAAALATQLRAEELIAVSIINTRDVEAVSKIADLGYEVDGEHYVSGIKAERGEMLNGLIAKAGFPADKIRTIIKVGDPVDELLRIAIKEKADLLVMGVKGRSNLEYMLTGSVAEKIFRRSPVPILSYRDEVHAARLRKNIRGG
jgi:nucleotide-binding universal stress UspA family protein